MMKMIEEEEPPPKVDIHTIVNPIKHLIKFPRVHIDNAVFRLHSKVSVFLLMVCCMIVSVGQFFGDPISCIVDEKRVPQEVMNTYCWIHSTFTLARRAMTDTSSDLAHPGVGPNIEEGATVTHTYYQWVCFTLFFQAVCFLFPYHLWKYWEGGKVAGIIPNELTHRVTDKRMPSFATDIALIPPEKLKVGVAKIKDYFIQRSQNRFQEHRYYLTKFTVCEVLNFVNVVLQLVLMNYFLGGAFTTYGLDVVALSEEDPEDRTDALNEVFPKVAKCTFLKYGPSGTIQNVDGLCVLALNIMNEKTYIVLWFWFYFLAVVTAIQLLWRLAVLTSGRLRESFLRTRTGLFVQQSDVTTVCNQITIGDWFILIQISENIDTVVFGDLVNQLSAYYNKINTPAGGIITTNV